MDKNFESETMPIKGRNEIQGNETIYWRADNLQDVMTMEALGEAIEKHGSLKVMQWLERIIKH